TLNFKIDDKNSIYISGYFGRDVFDVDDSFKNSYGNSVANLRWNHLFSDKLFSNLSLIYSDYYYGLSLDFVGFKWNSNIQNFNVKYDLRHYLSNDIELQYGLQNIYYKFNPGEIIPQNESSWVNYLKLIDKYANETAVYVQVDQKLSDKINIAYGLRFSNFIRLGQREYYTYEDDMPVRFNQTLDIYEKATPIDTISSSKSESLKTFHNFEPRFAISYIIDGSQSIKASYNRMSQYLHLISNTSSPTPLDVWAPSGAYIKPQILDQYALGYFKNFRQNYSIETEVFYKFIKNRVNYIDGADLIANQAIEQVILNGKSQAYGLEVLLKKNSGNLQGWISYTLSKSEQKTPGRTPDEPGINNGQWYNTPYDKTHDISLTASYSLSDNWSLAGNFIFQTGRPTTYPIGQYQYEGTTFPNFGSRNKNRLPFYPRLDFSATYTPMPKKKSGWRGEWVFSVYNIYDRKNAASLTFREDLETNQNEAVKLS